MNHYKKEPENIWILSWMALKCAPINTIDSEIDNYLSSEWHHAGPQTPELKP